MPRSFIRTPLACVSCRRRKTKCDGVRPRCRHCSKKDLQCAWSMPRYDAPSMSPTVLTPQPARSGSQVLDHHIAGELSHKTLQLCVGLFFERHFANDFCSFDQRPDFEQKCRQSPVLAASIVALCGRYLAPREGQSLFGLSSPDEVSKQSMQRARDLVKAVSDEPSVTHIQANLILALAELLSKSGSRHWLFTGSAIRMAEIMRLNKEFHQKHSLKEQEIRRRTFWACLLMDRALAYFLAKHRTIDNDTVSIALPGTDLSMLYQEETRGITLGSLITYGRPSDLGLSAYFIKTVCLWSDLADFAAYSRRRLEPQSPTDPQSMFAIRSGAVRAWADSLPSSLCWSIENYNHLRAFGQRGLFVSMQFLLRCASCVAHQCYLPQPTPYTRLDDVVDAAGWSYLYREATLVETCVSNALAIGEMLSYLMDPELADDTASLQTIWVASTVMTAANVLLWIQYANDETYSSAELRQKADGYFRLIHQLVSSWTVEWRVASQWRTALDVMQDLYKAAYLGELNERLLNHEETSTDQVEDDLSNDFRPKPGDGYPMQLVLPNLQASVKFATCDTSATSVNLPFILLQLSGGWPYGYAGLEYVPNSAEGASFAFGVKDHSSTVSD